MKCTCDTACRRWQQKQHTKLAVSSCRLAQSTCYRLLRHHKKTAGMAIPHAIIDHHRSTLEPNAMHALALPVRYLQHRQRSLGAVLVAEHDLLHAVDANAASKAQPAVQQHQLRAKGAGKGCREGRGHQQAGRVFDQQFTNNIGQTTVLLCASPVSAIRQVQLVRNN
jgi:hypothetical protein